MSDLLPRIKAVAALATESASVFMRDVGRGLFEVGHSSLAMIGLLVVAAALLGGSDVDLRLRAEQSVFDWLQARSDARESDDPLTADPEPDAATRATAADPSHLPKPQAAVALWLARRYRVAPEPISRLVQEAWKLGRSGAIDPTLILAVMAIESRFNPFAQSTVGAQGLMQVMTRVHDQKYLAFGGSRAAFDPVTNLRVGAQVLKECIDRAGGLEAGLRFYVGAGNVADDGGYVDKVLNEQANLRKVASGHAVAIGAMPPSASGPAPAAVQAPATVVGGDPVRVALAR
jgi:soluble lytic murein transglycosylase-like protein